MVRGSIPLNYQSGELFDLVYRWVNEIKFDDTARLLKIESNIHNLNGQLQFVEQNGDELKAIIQEGDLRIQHQDQNSIRVVASTISEEPQFYLFKSTPKYAAGFLVDQDSFLITLVNTLEQENLEFNYIHYFSNENNLSSTSNNLIYSIHLNPYFPELTLQIYPQDEDLISDLVKRRSWIYGVATFLLLAAMLLGIVLTQRDLAREKNLASLRSDFISNVTHELKTPLTSIRMYAESMMMRRLKSGPDQQKYLSVIVNESERLKRMINNILEFSKMEKDRQEYHPVEANLSDILNSAILDMTYWLEKNRFTLKQEIQPDVKALFDPDKLYQVFTNLLSNAIKYSDDSKNIYVRLYQNHDAVITEVKDEGIGISEKEQSKIFEEFYRVENHESGNIAGTGLGLTVVKEIVEAHHGQIKVE
jgi:signal transduction histidine kinase